MTSRPLILYVDDERPNRIVFEQTFANDFSVHAAASGEEALEILAQQDVAVLVSDQRMPGMSGNELLERAKKQHPNVIRMVITAYSDLDPILRAVNEGLVARYIIKPWVRDELREMLAWGLEAYDMGRQSSQTQLRLLETERLATLGSINAAVLHDIAQPLAYISSNTERLLQLSGGMPALKKLLDLSGETLPRQDRRRLEDLTSELPEILEDMMAGSRIMAGLTRSVRKLLRPTSEDEHASTDPMPSIRFTVSIANQAAMQARGLAEYHGPKQLPQVSIGSTELTQTLMNLLNNAAQALNRRQGPGGRVTLVAEPLADVVAFEIRDNGPGMSAAVLEKVGTPFFSTRSEGTGLGVHQCRRLIEKAGGTLEIDSHLGEGTTVRVRIPISH